MNEEKVGVNILSLYKILVNLARIILGFFIIKFNFSYANFIWFMSDKEIIHNTLINFGLRLIDFPSQEMARFLALILIFLSFLEIAFVIALLKRKKLGAIGIFSLAIVWTFIELVFVSQFMVASKMISVTINIIIIIFLYKLITKSRYLKKSRSLHKTFSN